MTFKSRDPSIVVIVYEAEPPTIVHDATGGGSCIRYSGPHFSHPVPVALRTEMPSLGMNRVPATVPLGMDAYAVVVMLFPPPPPVPVMRIAPPLVVIEMPVPA
jgi:hypothetical protein